MTIFVHKNTQTASVLFMAPSNDNNAYPMEMLLFEAKKKSFENFRTFFSLFFIVIYRALVVLAYRSFAYHYCIASDGDKKENKDLTIIAECSCRQSGCLASDYVTVRHF